METSDNIESIDETKLFQTIWTKPTETLDYILRNCPKKHLNALLFVGGVANAINRSSGKADKTALSANAKLIIAIVAGGFVGMLMYNIGAYLLSWTGRWLKGTADKDQFLTITAWSLVPSIGTLFLFVLQTIFVGNPMNPVVVSELGSMAETIYFLILFLDFVLIVWSVVILVKGIMIIQGFSAGKAFFNAMLPVLLFLVPIIVILLLSR